MTVAVKIPTPLRRLTDQQSTVSADGHDISAMIESLDASFPGIKARLCDDSGELRHFVNIYVNGEDIRYIDGTATTLSNGDEVSIVPAVAGGQVLTGYSVC